MKYIFTILFIVILSANLKAQDDVLEDEPYINGFFLSAGAGYSLRSGTTIKFDGRTYLKDALFNIDLKLGFDSKISQSVSNADYHPIDSNVLMPEKYKKNADFELGACYNFYREIRNKPKWIKTASSMHFDFYRRFNVTVIRLVGVRAGLGSYRGNIYGRADNILSKNKENDFQLDPSYYTATQNDSTQYIYNNFGGSYMYAGIQLVKVYNILLEGVLWNVRKAQHATYYLDVILPTSKKMSSLRQAGSTKSYEVSAKNKEVIAPIGVRFGMEDRVVRYAGLVFGWEAGIMPGYKINSNQQYISRKARTGEFFPATGFYFNASIKINITGPILQVVTDEFQQ
jgi:hypothetical protein